MRPSAGGMKNFSTYFMASLLLSPHYGCSTYKWFPKIEATTTEESIQLLRLLLPPKLLRLMADACALVQLQGTKEGIGEVGEVVVRLGRDDEMY